MKKPNHKHYNVVEEYSKLTMKELQAIQTQFIKAVLRSPEIKMFNEHLGFINKTIAERIGKSK